MLGDVRRRGDPAIRRTTRTNRVCLAEVELEPVCLVAVQRVVIEHFDVHEPYLKVLRRDERYAGWKMLLDLSVVV